MAGAHFLHLLGKTSPRFQHTQSRKTKNPQPTKNKPFPAKFTSKPTQLLAPACHPESGGTMSTPKQIAAHRRYSQPLKHGLPFEPEAAIRSRRPPASRYPPADPRRALRPEPLVHHDFQRSLRAPERNHLLVTPSEENDNSEIGSVSQNNEWRPRLCSIRGHRVMRGNDYGRALPKDSPDSHL